MMYYTFELDEESQEFCTIVTPFGVYRYQRLPMGVSQSPDIAQEIIEKVLEPLMDKIEAYIDDIAAFSNDWEAHKLLLRELLGLLQDAGFTINPLKCEWCVQETDFLGYWITPSGLKPWAKKIQAILDLQPPTNTKQLRSFLGMVGFYRDMWPCRSETLAPLTDLTGKARFQWTDIHQQAFDAMKALISTDALLAYPDHNKPFDIETDASDYQLGAVIKQNNRPVAYYSRKLNPAQRNYTTIEKELLSIVETLREFRTMLFGARINVYTDHKNLTHALTSFSTQRVLRWRLLLEEYGCDYFYKQGSRNLVADALSRVPTTRMERVKPKTPHELLSDFRNQAQFQDFEVDDFGDGNDNFKVTEDTDAMRRPLVLTNIVHGEGRGAMRLEEAMLNGAPPVMDKPAMVNSHYHGRDVMRLEGSGNRNSHNSHKRAMLIAGNHCHNNQDVKQIDCIIDHSCKMAECFLHYPVFDEGDVTQHPFHFTSLQTYQQRSAGLKRLLTENPGRFTMARYGSSNLVCYKITPTERRIVLSNEMLPRLVKWYHLVAGHAEGIVRLEATIKKHFYHSQLLREIKEQVGTCEQCQLNKRHNQQFGQLAPRQAQAAPWQEVHVDTIGPWMFTKGKGRNQVQYEIRALTCIDPVTNLLEICLLSDKTSAAAATAFENVWLSRYPRPQRVVHDRGPEFIGFEFQNLLLAAGIRARPLTGKNPQSNGIVQQVHRTVG
jgi:hypothetical protein